MPLISDVADPVERDHYRQQLARQLRVDERALQQVALQTAPTRRKQPTEPAASESLSSARRAENGASIDAALRGGRISLGKREANYLGQCLNYFPELPEEVDRSLAQLDQEPVTERDFANPENRALWRQLRHWMTTEPFATIDDLWDILDSTLRQQAQSLYRTEGVDPTHREKLPDLLANSVLDIRLEQARRQLSEVQQLSREGQQAGDAAVMELCVQQFMQLSTALQRLNKAKWSLSAVNRRQAEIDSERQLSSRRSYSEDNLQ
jgi:DNA primase